MRVFNQYMALFRIRYNAVPHQIQTVPANAPDSRRTMPGISR